MPDSQRAAEEPNAAVLRRCLRQFGLGDSEVGGKALVGVDSFYQYAFLLGLCRQPIGFGLGCAAGLSMGGRV